MTKPNKSLLLDEFILPSALSKYIFPSFLSGSSWNGEAIKNIQFNKSKCWGLDKFPGAFLTTS